MSLKYTNGIDELALTLGELAFQLQAYCGVICIQRGSVNLDWRVYVMYSIS